MSTTRKLTFEEFKYELKDLLKFDDCRFFIIRDRKVELYVNEVEIGKERITLTASEYMCAINTAYTIAKDNYWYRIVGDHDDLELLVYKQLKLL